MSGAFNGNAFWNGAFYVGDWIEIYSIQSPNFTPINEAQTPDWNPVDDSQTITWTEVVT